MTFLSSMPRGLLVAAFVVAPVLLTAGQQPIQKPGKSLPDQPSVEMFQAITDGQIAVKLIPKDSTQCRMLIENKTDKPLSVKLPEAFAGVPVLAQLGVPGGGGGGGGRRNGGSSYGGSQNQSFGGGGGMGGMGMGGMGMGGGFMNVPPEKIRELKIPIVCLEHGKKDPKATIPYEIRPLESFTQKPGVEDLMRMLGSGKISQRAAQAAAWHLNNDLSWQELANKQIHHVTGVRERYFSPQEIQAGMKLAAAARQMAEENKGKEKEKTTSLGQTLPPKQ